MISLIVYFLYFQLTGLFVLFLLHIVSIYGLILNHMLGFALLSINNEVFACSFMSFLGFIA